MSVQVKFTYNDLLTAPDDGNRYELFEGELIVTPSPVEKHQRTVSNLMFLLGHHINKHELGRLYTAPIDVYFDEETVVKPDLLFISTNRMKIIQEKRIEGAPNLVIEILSAGTEERDRGFKFQRYAKEGVEEYWLIDPEKEMLEIYRLTKTGYDLQNKFSGQDNVHAPIFSGFTFPVNELWK